jgi:hypothetical protein
LIEFLAISFFKIETAIINPVINAETNNAIIKQRTFKSYLAYLTQIISIQIAVNAISRKELKILTDCTALFV